MNTALLALTLLQPTLQHSSMNYTSLTNGPTVGDSASYQIHATQNGSTMDATLVSTITSVDASGNVSTSDVISAGGMSQTEAGQTTVEVLNALDSIVDNCSANTQPGQTAVLENISVPAGTILTCHITNSLGEFYLGHVPMGIVKMFITFEDGTINSSELTSFIKK